MAYFITISAICLLFYTVKIFTHKEKTPLYPRAEKPSWNYFVYFSLCLIKIKHAFVITEIKYIVIHIQNHKVVSVIENSAGSLM